MFWLIRIAAVVVFFVLPAVLVGAAWWSFGRGRRGWGTAAIVGAAAVVAVGVDAFWIEPTWLEVREIEIVSAKIDAPVTVALLADIQTDDPGDYERRVLELTADAEPDLILFAGDYVQAPGEARARAKRALNAQLRAVDWSPRLGAYAVGGNNEFGDEDWSSVFDGTGVRVDPGTRRVVDLGPLVLTALPAKESFDTAVEIPATAAFQIALGHAPDYSLGDVGADLMLAGHTHGGQVQLPGVGPLLTFSRVPRAHASGHTELDDGRHLIVSRGIGMERAAAPRLRFRCRPQLVLIRLLPAA